MSIFLVTILSCSQVIGILNRLNSVVGLTEVQKQEIIIEIRKHVKSCPIKIENK